MQNAYLERYNRKWRKSELFNSRIFPRRVRARFPIGSPFNMRWGPSKKKIVNALNLSTRFALPKNGKWVDFVRWNMNTIIFKNPFALNPVFIQRICELGFSLIRLEIMLACGKTNSIDRNGIEVELWGFGNMVRIENLIYVIWNGLAMINNFFFFFGWDKVEFNYRFPLNNS